MTLPVSPTYGQRPALPHQKDADVDPVSRGKVTGGIYDSVTYKPIAGATVSIRVDGIFESGKTVTTTDEAGFYKGEAEIGRTVKRTNAFLAVAGVAAGGVLPGTFSATSRTDVDQLILRVTAPGYKPFVGIVPCRRIYPAIFEVEMESVLLTPQSQPGASIVVPGWGAARFVELRVEPPIALPGQEVEVTMRIACPPPGKDQSGKEHPFKGFVDLEVGKQVELKQRTLEGDGIYAFRGKFKAPKLPRESVLLINQVSGSAIFPFSFSMSDHITNDFLFQVILNEGMRKEATQRAEAYRLYADGDTAGAAARFAALSRSASGLTFDHVMAGRLHNDLRQPAAAVDFFRSAFIKDKNGIFATYYSRALLDSDQPQRVTNECSTLLAGVKKPDELPRTLPSDFLVNLGTAYLRLGQIDKARETLDLLKKHWAPSQVDSIFDAAVRTAEADSRLKDSPQDAPALAERARGLRDQAQWAKAAQAYEAAQLAAPGDPVLLRDLAYTRLHLASGLPNKEELERAITAAESLTITKDGGKDTPVKDFLPWHILGILRYARAEQLRSQGSSELLKAYDDAHEAFDGALRNGRLAPPKRPWNAAGFHVVMAGFGSPDAAVDFDLRQSLLILRERPDDALALTELGKGLLDAGLPSAADAALALALRVVPDAIEPCYLRAVIAGVRQLWDEAISGLRDVVERAPNHSRARLLLAEYLEKNGDKEGAKAQRTAHSQLFRYKAPL
ncbi:MAG: tetratricopeptide repeat protein [Armatimonadetes bacterium]|nr:tetratricopeptide repeat protein [Armatimonadota bacterium]